MPTIHERTGVSRIVYSLQRTSVRQGPPNQLSLPGTVTWATREEQLLITKSLDDRACRTSSEKCGEEVPHGALYLLVWIDRDALCGVVDQTHGQGGLQLSAAGLVQVSTVSEIRVIPVKTAADDQIPSPAPELQDS